MTKTFHSQDRSDKPSQCTQNQQRFFADSPFFENRLPFIYSPKNKRDTVDESEVDAEDDQPELHRTNRLLK